LPAARILLSSSLLETVSAVVLAVNWKVKSIANVIKKAAVAHLGLKRCQVSVVINSISSEARTIKE